MSFNSMLFLWCFLPICIIGYYLITPQFKNIFLVFFSLIFYAWGEPKLIILLIASIIVNYIIGVLVCKYEKYKRIFCIIGVAFNLGILVVFKYLSFFMDNLRKITGNEFSIIELALPIGISFYTFQAISYIVDTYKEPSIAKCNIADVALYLSFFPKLTAGPIVKYSDMEFQLRNHNTDKQMISYGIKRFIYGLGKKVIIAGTLASVVDKVYAMNIENLGTGIAWLGAIGYTLQIYFDFSGYSDMAIGLAKMFGFSFKENFDYPYMSRSIQEFWRRWHISLSTWFKNYLYIPIGGNRKGGFTTYRNLLLVFFMTGLWHGASWNFIVWGLFHGAFMILERGFLGNLLKNKKMKWISNIYLLVVVTVGWVIFRANNLYDAFAFIGRMFSLNASEGIGMAALLDIETIVILILAILLSGLLQKMFLSLKTQIYNEVNIYVYEIVGIVFILLCSIMYMANNAYSPFIYFKF